MKSNKGRKIMNYKKINYILIIIFFALLFNITACAAPKAKIIAKVVDEETGNIIQGADVSIGFVYESSWGKYTMDKQKGKSDKEGLFTGSGVTRSNISPKAQKDGYYKSGVWMKGLLTHNKLLNRWEPYPCEVTIKLRRIKEPVPMFVKNVRIKIPEKNKPIGFDLEVGDWVSPYGKGKVSDLTVNYDGYAKSMTDYKDEMTLIFEKSSNGLLEYDNELYFYLAPLKNYHNLKSSLISTLDKDSEGGGFKVVKNYNSDQNYLFRVRTIENNNGDILSANYGYISNLACSDRDLIINYRFNPNNKSRSLEWNEVNLFDDKKKQENDYKKFREKYFANPEEK